MRTKLAAATGNLLAICFALFCQLAIGEDRLLPPAQRISRIPPPSGKVLGFTATVQLAQQDIAGSIPVEIQVTSTSRFTADRRLLFRFQPIEGAQLPPPNGMIVDVPVTATQGQRSVKVVRYLPKWSAGNGYFFQVFEGGQPLDDYDSAIGNSIVRNRFGQPDVLKDEYEKNWVVIEPKDTLTAVDQNRVKQMMSPAVQRTRQNFSEILAITGLRDVPEDWRAYQRFDVVLVSPESLEKLKEKEKALAALRQWVLAGGVVIGYNAESPQSLADSLDFAWTDDASAKGFIVAVAASMISDASSQDRINLGSMNLPGNPALPAEQQAVIDQIKKLQQARAPILLHNATQWGNQVWMQQVGGGLMIGIQENDSHLPAAGAWSIVNQLIDFRQSPMLRRGVDPMLGDRRFTRWLIPGVAQPPVYTFIGLLTVFVILVGPIAYRRTTRYGRGYLMFAIAPLLAMVTTLAMFGYGIVSDGFGTSARVRQLTWVDGASGDSVERVRATYFAGVRPSEGLRFPGNAEVVGYRNNSGQAWEEIIELPPAVMGRAVVTEKAQVFDQSFLPSRQQRQFVTHQPRPKIGKISLRVDGNNQQLQSTLDFDLQKIVVRDASGIYWKVDSLPAGGKVDCEKRTSQQASKLLGKMYNDHRPLSAVREARQRNNYQVKVRDLIIHASRSFTSSGNRIVTDGGLENWLWENLQLGGELPKRSFVATTEVSRDVLAVDSAKLVDSVRYVFGTIP